MRPILIYDAECRLCVASQKLLVRWDRHGRILCLPFQDPSAKRWVPELASMDCRCRVAAVPREARGVGASEDPATSLPHGPPHWIDAMRLVDEEGRVWSGVEVLRRLFPLLPGGRIAALIFSVPGVSPLARRIYGWVARNRYRLFGRAGD